MDGEVEDSEEEDIYEEDSPVAQSPPWDAVNITRPAQPTLRRGTISRDQARSMYSNSLEAMRRQVESNYSSLVSNDNE